MSRKLALGLLLTAFALAVGGTMAYAVVIGPDGTIHGCYSNAAQNGNHLLFVTDTTCGAGSTTLNWNQTGPQGPVGPPGPQGLPGPAPTTYMRLHTIQAGTGTLYEVFCDVNPATNQRDTATGGGANYVSRGEAVGISGSYPIVSQATATDGARPVGWHIDYAMYSVNAALQPGGISGGAAPGTVNAWLVCQR